MKRPFLSDEEEALWAQEKKNAKPIAARKKISSPMTQKKMIKPAVMSPKAIDLPPQKNGVMVGDYAGIDKNTATRFKKGEMSVDGTLDLHGMNRQQAADRVLAFIENHYARGSRALLVITGKGKNTHGILREWLPDFIAHAPISGCILALDSARAKHGGQGAYYVLLRRKR